MLTKRQSYRLKADLTLAGVFLLFLVSWLLRRRHPHEFIWELINFTLEAALVGGLADWFAVTAIFRRPLGWPFHTALIPRNREKVIEGIENILTQNLLTRDLIAAKIKMLQPTRKWLAAATPEALESLVASAAQKFRSRLSRLPTDEAADFLAEELHNHLKKSQLNAQTAALLQTLFQQPQYAWQLILKKLINKVSAPSTKEYIKHYLYTHKEAKFSSPLNRTLFRLLESIDAVNLDDAADALQVQLCTSLHSLHDPNHPLRQLFDSTLQTFLGSLASAYSNGFEQWKNEVLLSYPWGKNLRQFFTILQKELAEEQSFLSRWLDSQMENLFRQFAKSGVMPQILDDYLQTSLLRLALANHHWVGQIARTTLENFSNTDLSMFIEEKVGNDLQWIRINGSLVGGLIGLTLFLVLHIMANL